MVKYSIIIPTYNRVETLVSTLNTALNQPGTNFEVIVHDNASNDGTKDYLRSISHPSLKCYHLDKHVSMTENWSLALDKINGEYVFILGDDDAIMPNALTEMDQYLEKYPDLDVVAWLRYDYGWPSTPTGGRNRLFLRYENSCSLIDTKEHLRKILNFELSHEYLPKIYSSFVSRKLIDRVIAKCGQYFVEPNNPDMASGIINLCLSDNILFTHRALSIIGTSGKSNGASHLYPSLGNFDTMTDSATHLSTKLHNLLETEIEIKTQNMEMGIINTYLLSIQKAGLPVVVDMSKIILKIWSSVLSAKYWDTEMQRAYLDSLARKHNFRITWPESVTYPAEQSTDGVKYGPIYHEGSLAGVSINTALLGIMDIYRASLLAGMLTR